VIILLAPSVAFLHADPSVLGLSPDGVSPAAAAPAEQRPDPVPTPSPWNRATMLRHLNFWTIAIPFALGLTAQVGFLTHQISYLAPRLGTSGAGLAVSLTTIAAVIGRLLTGACIDRLDRRLVSAGRQMQPTVARQRKKVPPKLPALSSALCQQLPRRSCTDLR
jgi:hypothetical protein